MGETTGYIRCPSDSTLYEHFKKVKNAGLKIGAHAENDAILQHMKKVLIDSGRKDPRAHLDSRPAFAEQMAISKGIILSEATGCPFHVFHLSTARGVDEVRCAKERGLPVTAEVLVAHLLLNDSSYDTLGNLIRLNPPIRTKDHQDALWRGIKTGWLDNIATDHAPHSREEKTADLVWDAACGFVGVETFLPLMLTEVNKGMLTLEEMVRLTSENPAKIWNIYPQKGAVRLGSDADIVIVDLTKKGTIAGPGLHSKDKLTPYEGWQITGIPLYTILRGNIIMENGAVMDKPSGEMVKPQRRG
jgi:dihydroorotase